MLHEEASNNRQFFKLKIKFDASLIVIHGEEHSAASAFDTNIRKSHFLSELLSSTKYIIGLLIQKGNSQINLFKILNVINIKNIKVQEFDLTTYQQSNA